MLDIEILAPTEIEKAASIFHRYDFIVVRDALTPNSLHLPSRAQTALSPSRWPKYSSKRQTGATHATPSIRSSTIRSGRS